MVKIEVANLNALLKALHRKAQHMGRGAVAVTSYSTDYAVYIHENLQLNHAAHGCGGQAKYLEEPARTKLPELRAVAASAMRRNRYLALAKAVLEVARTLLTFSRPLVPVDTGKLRDSGRARLESAGFAFWMARE